MSKSGVSVFVWGIYVTLIGLNFAFVPSIAPPGLDPPSDFWGRTVGVIALALGYYYIRLGRGKGMEKVYAWTVHGRGLAVILEFVFIAMNVLPMGFLPLAIIELAGTLWTAIALRSEGKSLIV
jgi:hypothetical protein